VEAGEIPWCTFSCSQWNTSLVPRRSKKNHLGKRLSKYRLCSCTAKLVGVLSANLGSGHKSNSEEHLHIEWLGIVHCCDQVYSLYVFKNARNDNGVILSAHDMSSRSECLW